MVISTEYGTRLDNQPFLRSATVDGVPDFANLYEYEYDDLNRWIARRQDPDWDGPQDFTDNFFVYDGTPPSGSLLDRAAVTMENIGQIVLHFEADGQGDPQLAHRYLWGPAVDQILADEQITDPTAPGNVVWPLTDHLNTVRDLAAYDANTDTTTIIRRASLGSGIVFGVRRVIGLAYSLFSRRIETSGDWCSCSGFQQIQGGQQMGGVGWNDSRRKELVVDWRRCRVLFPSGKTQSVGLSESAGGDVSEGGTRRAKHRSTRGRPQRSAKLVPPT